MLLKSYSSTTVKSKGGKNKSAIIIRLFVQTFFYVGTLKNASHSKFSQNTKLNIAIDNEG